MKTIELINLTLNEIRRSAQVVADVENDYRHLIFNMEKDGCNAESIEFNKQCADDMQSGLNNCRLALRDVLENIANVQNFKDMVSPVDAALGKVAYDLIYERTTDEDYDKITDK